MHDNYGHMTAIKQLVFAVDQLEYHEATPSKQLNLKDIATQDIIIRAYTLTSKCTHRTKPPKYTIEIKHYILNLL